MTCLMPRMRKPARSRRLNAARTSGRACARSANRGWTTSRSVPSILMEPPPAARTFLAQSAWLPKVRAIRTWSPLRLALTGVV